MVYTRGITPPRTLIPSHATSGVIPPSYLDTLPRHARYNSASHLDTLPHHAHTTIPRSRDVKSSHGEHCRTDEPYLCAGRGAATATPAWTAGLNSIRRANRPPASWLLASARLPSEFPMSDISVTPPSRRGVPSVAGLRLLFLFLKILCT
jgi:hypothetical protein